MMVLFSISISRICILLLVHNYVTKTFQSTNLIRLSFNDDSLAAIGFISLLQMFEVFHFIFINVIYIFMTFPEQNKITLDVIQIRENIFVSN